MNLKHHLDQYRNSELYMSWMYERTHIGSEHIIKVQRNTYVDCMYYMTNNIIKDLRSK